MRTRLPVKLKVAIVTAALTFVILCLFATVIGALAEQRISSGFEDDIRATASELQDQLTIQREADGSYHLDRSDVELLRGFAAADAFVRVLDSNGRVVYATSSRSLGPPVEGIVDVGDVRVVSRQIVAAGLESPGDFGGYFNPLPRPVAQPIGFVQYGKLENSVQTTINRVRVFLAFGVLGGTLLAFLGGLLVAKRAMRPIAGLTRAAREVARTRDPDITLPKPRANDEVADLANTFEDMLRELSAAREETEATLERQRAFVADASHELRTPLTSILANLELLDAELSGEHKEMADSALRSSRRMRRLVGDLLLLARADAGREVPQTRVDLAAVATEAATEAGVLSSDHPLALDLPDAEAPVIVSGVADDLHRLAGNLVENALLHTPAGTPITVSVRRHDGDAVLEVADRGPGVPEEMRTRVFERFARGPGEVTPRGGSGLGLAIVRAVTDSHRGQVELLEAEGGGARFVVTLPAESRSDAGASVLAPSEPIPDS